MYKRQLNDSPKIIHASRATYIGDVCIAGITREGSSRLSIQNMNISVNACKTPIDQACTKTIKPTPAGKVVSKTIVPNIPWLPPTHRLKLGRGIPNPDSTFLSTSVTMENTSGFASAARIQSSKVGQPLQLSLRLNPRNVSRYCGTVMGASNCSTIF